MQKQIQFLETQKIIMAVFNELKETTEKMFTHMNQLGWKQRNVLISHVYSNYEKHEELQRAKSNWEKACTEHRVHARLYQFFQEYRDLYGYFPQYPEMLDQLDDLLRYAVEHEEFEIAAILEKWRSKLTSIQRYTPSHDHALTNRK